MQSNSYTLFDGHRQVARGPLQSTAIAFKRLLDEAAAGPVLIFDDGSGRSIDIDTRGSEEEVLARLALPAPAADEQRGRGRPKLGVIAREVTLLPRHWEWLAAQPGGASVTLRKLVEDARRNDGAKAAGRAAQERAYHFMSAMAGDMAGFEEASRALFADERARFADLIANWPGDVRDHLVRLAFGDAAEGASE